MPSIFQPLKDSATLRTHTVEVLTDAIFTGKIKPGERLNESQLSRELGISRAPVREALQQLQEQSLIVNVPRRGMFVVNLDEADIQEINSLRVILEAEALRLARANVTLQQAAKLKQMLGPIEDAKLLPTKLSARFDLDLHRTIWTLSGNRHLEKTLISLTAPLFAHSVRMLLNNATMQVTLDSHRGLVSFICGETNQSAEEIMREHLFRLRPPQGISDQTSDYSVLT